MRFTAFAILLTSTIASADSRLPSHYAKLFDATSTWTYDVSLTTWDYDQIQNEPNAKKWKKKTEKLAPITCKVGRVGRVGDRTVGEVTCDREEGWKFIVAGIYFTTSKGREEGGPRYTLTTSVKREGTAWCASDSTSGAPHDGTSTTCYGGVITRVRNDVGGELNDLVFRVRP